MNNKYYELHIKVYLINDIDKSDMYDKIAKFTNFSFNNSQILSCLHKSKGFKHISYSGLYPIEKDGVYKANEIYEFLFRSYKSDIIYEEQKCLEGLENDDFIVTSVICKVWDHKNIDYIDNLTPTILTMKSGQRWNKDVDKVDIAKEGIFKNLIRKYNSLNDTNFKFEYKDIIKNIIIKSKCAIVINYKNVKFLGYKFRIYFQNNSIAQELANLAVVEGIGEKNSSFGMGFVKPYFWREKDVK
jgi:CRISPR-associated endoribonuclease Cas6